ncbi:hypothetical protein M0812_21092 [Anaeramoeba flamelloides]|uniref:Uncharacterized protein n=1 Tax=Anaeramoeba flamelloides TaxID=1746091 RepID=A0AAV7YU16_9EUKA|nr:hypothetical protein M0812_21092 [Anaeramoeba flamelloides]
MFGVFGTDPFVQKLIRGDTILKSMAGTSIFPIKERTQNQKQKCKKRFIFVRIAYDLWNSWNKMGSPIIKTWDEWINKLNNQESSETETDIDTTSDSDYKDEGGDDETKTSNLEHQPSYNEEELRIYRMMEEANGKELQTKIFTKQKKEEKEKKKEEKRNQIERLQKKFQPKEDQIIRQKSLESGKEPLKPSINSELLSPHSNYLVDSDQMILLLNNVHCPCGRKKLLVDIKEGYGSFKAVLLCPNCPLKQWESNQEEFYFSKKIEQKAKQKNRIKLNLKQKSGSER